ncbi:MAG: cytochrome C peroxidase [Cytophagales bacterium]|nr:MAG: cytochrome C peroxidase [Cytophagales bacterium]
MRRSPRFLAYFAATTLLMVFLLGTVSRLNTPRSTPLAQLHAQVRHDLDSLDHLLITRLLPLVKQTPTAALSDSLQRAFVACRMAYKQVEPFTEYYFPATSRLVNGPPLPEVEVEETKQFEPGGLQVIEELIYPAYDPANREDLQTEIGKLTGEIRRTKTLWDVTELTDAHVFDVLRLQVFRVIALGISGFDTPLCQTAMPEAGETFATLQTVLQRYADDSQESLGLLNLARGAETYCRELPNFEQFDRAHFILTYANPLSERLLSYGKRLDIQPFDEVRMLRADAPTLFARNAFDPDALAQTVEARQNPAKIALGKQLFFDPVLSGGNGRSCASCHQPDKAFSDGLAKAATLGGRGQFTRNTPTLLNAALQRGQFYDLRAQSLESQAFSVIHNVDEMHGSLSEAARTLQKSADWVRQFAQAFPDAKGRIEPVQIQNALAAYERTLIDFDSRFDQYMRGQKAALNEEEVAGFNLFMGKAKCGICHFVPLFNGTVPPAYAKSESEVIGVPATAKGTSIDPDMGRYVHTKLDPLKYAFKTPTLRNIGQTAPYMHNGVYRTLNEVVDFYNRGGGTGLGFALDNQTLPGDKLNLNTDEKQALVAFMKAL